MAEATRGLVSLRLGWTFGAFFLRVARAGFATEQSDIDFAAHVEGQGLTS